MFSHDARARINGLIGAGALRNTLKIERVTCAICTRPVDGYPLCYRCNEHRQAASAAGERLANLVAPLFYAVREGQSGHMMRNYKAVPPVPVLGRRLRNLLHLAFTTHLPCISRSVGLEPAAWSVVPSTHAPRAAHPFRQVAVDVLERFDPLRQIEVTLEPGPNFAPTPRRYVSGMWKVADSGPTEGRHVLLLDDTWTTGGNAQSAAATLRNAGARAVTIMPMGRWLDPEYTGTSEFLTERLTTDYEFTYCPVDTNRCETIRGPGR